MAKLEIRNSTFIDAPVESVFAIMADIDNHVEIFSINREIRGYHGGPAKEGDTWQTIGSFMGQETVTNYTMAEISEPSRLLFTSVGSGGDGSIEWTFTGVEGGTQVESYAQGEPKGFFGGLAARLLKGNLEKQVKQDHQNLKNMAESASY